jgi:cyclopropane-fatty-acyl-phospholipid synthase
VNTLAALPGGLAVEWPGGRLGTPESAVCMRLHRRALLALLRHGRIGDLAQAYVRGELELEGAMPDVMAVAGELVGNPVDDAARLRGPHWLQGLLARWRHRRSLDSRRVRDHYDAGDDFFALWLDAQRVYSCAYFSELDMTLEQAQQAKLELICRKLHLAPGQRLLDVGCGWGALLRWAAMHHGVRALGITLSRNQHAHVQQSIVDAGLGGRVEVRLMDYRDLPHSERFDRIASVGMFEHVGRAQLVPYFRHLQHLLRPGGLLLNHGIAAGGIGLAQLGAGMGDFIERHIFPGGELVHVSEAAHAMAAGGLELVDAENLRPHYARTLWHWSARLEQQLVQARALTSEATVRAYRLYLAGSAMCFERGWLSLYQLLAARPDSDAPPCNAWPARSDYPFQRSEGILCGNRGR